MLTHETFFVGVGGVVLGALIGAWVGARLTYGFQKKLLKQQMDAEEKSHKLMMSILETGVNSFNVQFNQIKGYFSEIVSKLEK